MVYCCTQHTRDLCQEWRESRCTDSGDCVSFNNKCACIAGATLMILTLVVTVILYTVTCVTVDTLQCHTDQTALSGSSLQLIVCYSGGKEVLGNHESFAITWVLHQQSCLLSSSYFLSDCIQYGRHIIFIYNRYTSVYSDTVWSAV